MDALDDSLPPIVAAVPIAAPHPQAHSQAHAQPPAPAIPTPATLPAPVPKLPRLTTPARPPSPPAAYPPCGSDFLRHLRTHGRATSTSYPFTTSPPRCPTPLTPPLSSSPRSVYSDDRRWSHDRGVGIGAGAGVSPRPAPTEGRCECRPSSSGPNQRRSASGSGSDRSSTSERSQVPDMNRFQQFQAHHPHCPRFRRRQSSTSSVSAVSITESLPAGRLDLSRSSTGRRGSCSNVPEDHSHIRRTSTPTLCRRPILPHEPRVGEPDERPITPLWAIPPQFPEPAALAPSRTPATPAPPPPVPPPAPAPGPQLENPSAIPYNHAGWNEAVFGSSLPTKPPSYTCTYAYPPRPRRRASVTRRSRPNLSGQLTNLAQESAGGWHEFALAYSQGSFDPLHTPLFPGSPRQDTTLPMKELHSPKTRISAMERHHSERHPSLHRPTSAPQSPIASTRAHHDDDGEHHVHGHPQRHASQHPHDVDPFSLMTHPPDSDHYDRAPNPSHPAVPNVPHPVAPPGDFSIYKNIRHPDEIRVFYKTHGFLPAPLPPNEAERLKALYSFNILQTGSDLNFDRIVHMTKLVFNSRLAFLSLLDSEAHWYKSYSGLGYSVNETRRSVGFCGHVVLLNSDEPFVVLDTTKDWRFMNSPVVKDYPRTRFYAGAPLRTADGYNLGTLAVADDRPRSEFSPRSRLILKEFAAIVMRELELWRDRLQLRVRDRVQQSMENFTRECLEIKDENLVGKTHMDMHLNHVYRRAAEVIMTTLDLDGCTILDIGQFERVELRAPDDTTFVTYQANPYSSHAGASPQATECASISGDIPPLAFPVLASTCPDEMRARCLEPSEYELVSQFLSEHRDGRIFNVPPPWLRWVFPRSIKYAMVVPIMGVDQQPFAIITAHTHDKGKQFLEGFELQFLRGIGAIILSAVLRRKTVLADRSKNVIISSVSHELRTPLHGMLAAGELLSDTPLDTAQEAFLATLRTCGLQLIETVNHVLDFAKLSIEGKDHTTRQIQFRRVDLAELIHSTLEGCWLGQRARQMQMMDCDSDLGCFYSPEHKGLLPAEQRLNVQQNLSNVESVLDVGFRPKGWNVICETGGLRRIIMNLYNNSLKYTKEGYVQIALRELPHPPGERRIPVEIRVIDTGKGIGQAFLKNQMFQPFAQENPLQPGTGLGLAIVGNIVTSDAMRGNLNVYSAEDVGTEIRIQFEVETVDEDEDGAPLPGVNSTFGTGYKLAFVNYTASHRGLHLQAEVLGNYARCLGFGVTGNVSEADILIVNEAEGVTQQVRETCGERPMLLVISFKIQDMTTLEAMGRTKAYTGILYKPLGIAPFVRALEAAVAWTVDPHNPELLGALAYLRKFDDRRESMSMNNGSDPFVRIKDASKMLLAHRPRTPLASMSTPSSSPSSCASRHPPSLCIESPSPGSSAPSASCPPHHPRGMRIRPLPSRAFSAPLAPGSVYPIGRVTTTATSTAPTTPITCMHSPDIPRPSSSAASSVGSNVTGFSTVSIADGGVMLASCQPQQHTPLGELRHTRPPRIMVVEDNPINRRVLIALLKKRQFEYIEAVNGAVGVELFRSSPPNYWDAILMDITMPVMDGLEATRAVRRIESARRALCPAQTCDMPPPSPLGPPFDPSCPSNVLLPPMPVLDNHTKIFALTGLATVDDKRKAFASGVDGYLVKPVSLGTLDLLFKKIGF